jgi:hypothetical protein
MLSIEQPIITKLNVYNELLQMKGAKEHKMFEFLSLVILSLKNLSWNSNGIKFH